MSFICSYHFLTYYRLRIYSGVQWIFFLHFLQGTDDSLITNIYIYFYVGSKQLLVSFCYQMPCDSCVYASCMTINHFIKQLLLVVKIKAIKVLCIVVMFFHVYCVYYSVLIWNRIYLLILYGLLFAVRIGCFFSCWDNLMPSKRRTYYGVNT